MSVHFNPSRFSEPKEVNRSKAAELLIQLRKRLGRPYISYIGIGGNHKVYQFPHNVFDTATIITRKD